MYLSKPKNQLPIVFNRRDFMIGAGGLLVSLIALDLEGCGGRGGFSSNPSNPNQPPAFFVTNVSGTVSLPTGVLPSSVTLVTGESEVSILQGAFRAKAPGNMPTIACVLDNTSGNVIMPCMIDPTAGAAKLDSTNVAATLIFLCVGGWTLKLNRHQVWTSILADPATAAFAAIVKSRLATNPFATVDGDAQLIAGLKSAISSLTLKLPVADGVAKPALIQSHGQSSGALPPLPNPFVYLYAVPLSVSTTIGGEQQRAGLFSILAPGTESASPCYFQFRNPDIIERVFLVSYATKELMTQIQIGQPTIMPPSGSSNVLTFPIQNQADEVEILFLDMIAPVFDSPVASQTSNLDSVISALQAAAWERATVGISSDFIVSALGGTLVSHDATLLNSTIQTLKGLSSTMSTAIGLADAGKNFPGAISDFLAGAAQPGQDLGSIVEALRTLSPDLPQTVSTKRLAQLRSLLGLAASIGLQQLSVQYSQTYSAYVFNAQTDVPADIRVSGEISQVSAKLLASSLSLDPGGSPTTLSAFIIATYSGDVVLDPTSPFLSYKYQFSGSPNVTMSDSKGNKGNSFETKSSTVELVAKGETTGKQIVTVEVFDTETGTPVSIGKASLTLGDTATISPADQTIQPGAQLSLTVLLASGVNAGELPANAIVTWTLTGTGTINPGSGVASSSAKVTYTAPSVAETDTLAVVVKDSSGNVIGTASTTISVVPSPLVNGDFSVGYNPNNPPILLSTDGSIPGWNFVITTEGKLSLPCLQVGTDQAPASGLAGVMNTGYGGVCYLSQTFTVPKSTPKLTYFSDGVDGGGTLTVSVVVNGVETVLDSFAPVITYAFTPGYPPYGGVNEPTGAQPQQKTYDLTKYVGQSVELRFGLMATDSGQNFGSGTAGLSKIALKS